MLVISRPFSLTTLTVLCVLQLSACGDTVDSCEDTRKCASSGGSTGDGDGTGGEDPSGSGGNGDGDGDATTDTETGGGTTGDGDELCLPATCPGGYCEGADCLECVHGDEERFCKDAAQPACLEDNTCAECASNADCTDEAFSVCDEDTHECVPCRDDDGCSHLEATNMCDTESSVCIECTIETEVDKCGAKSCDPATNTCTDTDTNSVKTCEPCVADSECQANHHCVPMNYKGEERGGYCLKTGDGGCFEPYTIPFSNRETLSGTSGETYCGINEELTTCEAILALTGNMPCPDGDECPEGGLCRTVGLTPNRCTYECSGVSQCDEAPNPGSTCDYGTPPPASGGSTGSGGNAGTGGQKYCGG